MIGSDDGLAPNKRQAIICTDNGCAYWRTYESLGLDVLKNQQRFRQWLYKR